MERITRIYHSWSFLNSTKSPGARACQIEIEDRESKTVDRVFYAYYAFLLLEKYQQFQLLKVMIDQVVPISFAQHIETYHTNLGPLKCVKLDEISGGQSPADWHRKLRKMFLIEISTLTLELLLFFKSKNALENYWSIDGTHQFCSAKSYLRHETMTTKVQETLRNQWGPDTFRLTSKPHIYFSQKWNGNLEAKKNSQIIFRLCYSLTTGVTIKVPLYNSTLHAISPISRVSFPSKC